MTTNTQETAAASAATPATAPAASFSKPPDSTAIMAQLYEPLPTEAVKEHPTKAYLSTVKNIYQIDRLNQVFGVAGWTTTDEIIENQQRWDERRNDKGETRLVNIAQVVMRVTLEVPAHGIRRQGFGGNDNEDRGDAYKGAYSDALSKICAGLGIGMDAYKGFGPTKNNPNPKPRQAKPAAPNPPAASVPKPESKPPAKAPSAAPLPLSVSTREEFFASNGAGRRNAFAEALRILPPDTAARIFSVHGASSVEDFKSANKAWGCYDQLVAAARTHLSRSADPTTFEHFVAQEGAAA